MGFDQCTESFERPTVGDGGFERDHGFGLCRVQTAEHEHFGAERIGDFHQICGTLTAQALDRLNYLQRIADHAPEGFVHPRKQGGGRFAHAGANRDE